MSDRPIYDCHVNIWEERHVRPLYAEQMARVRTGAMQEKADAATLYAAMAKVDKAIIFTLRYGDSAGIDGDDETTAAAVAAYPDKFVGFAAVDPRRPDYMDLLRHAIEDLGLRGVKFGPIYNGVPLSDPRLEPLYEYCTRHDLPLTLHMGTRAKRRWSRPRHPRRADRHALAGPEDHPRPHGSSLVRGVIVVVASSRTSTASVRLLLPAVAVLQHPRDR